jgi:hypothetical protein
MVHGAELETQAAELVAVVPEELEDLVLVNLHGTSPLLVLELLGALSTLAELAPENKGGPG